MRSNSYHSVDVRFFGAHEQAWIPAKDVFLYSLEPPVAVKVMKIRQTKFSHLLMGYLSVGVVWICYFLTIICRVNPKK